MMMLGHGSVDMGEGVPNRLCAKRIRYLRNAEREGCEVKVTRKKILGIFHV
jgi:hypothetical protein